MKVLISIIICTCTVGLSPMRAQDADQSPENIPGGLMTVTGEAVMKVQPDEVVARFRMESKSIEYDITIQTLGSKTDRLAEILIKAGYSKENLKTTQLVVSKNYLYTERIRKDSGYVASQMLELTFPMDPEAIIQLINTVSDSSVDPQLSFDFQVSEEKVSGVKENLITLAVKDAREKAEIIANASRSEIKGIRKIRYGDLTRSEPSTYRMMESTRAEDPAFGGFNVQDLTFMESIEITYLIGKK